MAKTHTRFVCQECGRVAASYMGKCPQCGSFNSMVEEVIHDEPVTKNTAVRGLTGRSAPRSIGEVSTGDEDRIRVPIEEFARVLGGGIVPGSIVLVGGDPGIGKSTLMLQMAMEMASSAGSVSQVRECSSQLRELAKTSGISVFVIGHVTKEGTIAGPRVLEHIVDTVLYLEGDRFQAYRLLRSVKNRFGATSEVGVFEMREGGLVEVTNPSEAFLAERMVNAAGSAIAVTMEATRPILVEVQGLTSPTQFGNARRTANGVDFNRLLLISAVLTRRVGLKLAEQDVFVNVVGGFQIDEPAADLAVAAAIASSWRDVPLKAEAVLFGEIGLAGELRMPGQMQVLLREAKKLGFKTAVVPKIIRKGEGYPKGIEIVEVRSVDQALSVALTVAKQIPKEKHIA